MLTYDRVLSTTYCMYSENGRKRTQKKKNESKLTGTRNDIFTLGSRWIVGCYIMGCRKRYSHPSWEKSVRGRQIYWAKKPENAQELEATVTLESRDGHMGITSLAAIWFSNPQPHAGQPVSFLLATSGRGQSWLTFWRDQQAAVDPRMLGWGTTGKIARESLHTPWITYCQILPTLLLEVFLCEM
jgi:hypothetical protein